MPDFFADSINHGVARLSMEDSHHAIRVLRLKEGDDIRISVQGKRYKAVLMFDNNSKYAYANIVHELSSSEAIIRITLYQGIPKGDKLEQIVRQSTELGVFAVVPCQFIRCIAKPGNANQRMSRLNKIAREAAMQSGRTTIPLVEEPITFLEMNQRLTLHQQALIAYEQENTLTPEKVYTGAKDLALVIGPEGGFAPEEIDSLKAQAFSLGPRILRTETAGIAAISMIRALANDF